MSIKQAFNKWTGIDDTSHMEQDNGITGLKLATDDESTLLDDYVKLPVASEWYSGSSEWADLYSEIVASLNDEIKDYTKYSKMAQAAIRLGHPEIALPLQIIATEQHNHHEILEALLSGHERYETPITGREEHMGIAGENMEPEELMTLAVEMDKEWQHGEMVDASEVLAWMGRTGTAFMLTKHDARAIADEVNKLRGYGYESGNGGIVAELEEEPDFMRLAEEMDASWQPVDAFVSMENVKSWLQARHINMSSYQIAILRAYVNARRGYP